MRLRARGFGLVVVAGLLVGGGCAQTPDRGDSAESEPVRALDPSFGLAGVTRLAMSPEADRLVAVVPGPDGTSYAAGFLTTGGDQAMAVARLDADGDPDFSFGENGFTSMNVAVGGGTGERATGVGVQSGGKIVVAGPVEHDPAAGDTDLAAVRFNEDGSPDTGFGDDGVVIVDLGAGREVEEDFVGDTMFGLTVLSDDRLLLVGAKLHEGPDETDRDFAVVRLTAEGERDSSFGDDGIFVLDIEDGNETPRQAVELDDGSVVVSGYTRNLDGVVAPVLLKLTEEGELDGDFGTGGVASAELLSGVSEAYEVGLQGDDLVIAGYGRGSDDDTVDLIAARFTSAGELDTAFGEEGLVRVDVSGQDDRGRDLVVLEDGSILIAGSAKPAESEMNALLVMLTPDGELDPAFGREGVFQVDLGGPGDSFYSVALDEGRAKATIVGWSGPESSSGGNEDSVIARLAL